MEMQKVVGALLAISVLCGLSVLGPIFTIWSLNALFHLGIPISFKTWVAVLWIMTVLYGIRMNFND